MRSGRQFQCPSQDYFKSGKNYYDNQKYSEASVQLLNAVQKDPKNRDARYYLALSYLNQKNLNDAAKQLASLLEYYPDDVEASLRLGNLYLAAGGSNSDFFQKADELAKKILSKDPQNVAALILVRAMPRQDCRTIARPWICSKRPSTLDPQNTAAFVSLGTAQALQKNYPGGRAGVSQGTSGKSQRQKRADFAGKLLSCCWSAGKGGSPFSRKHCQSILPTRTFTFRSWSSITRPAGLTMWKKS